MKKVWWRRRLKSLGRTARYQAGTVRTKGGGTASAGKSPSGLDGFGKWLDFGQKLFTFGSALIGGLVLLFLLTVGRQQSIVIERFSVAQDMKNAGYDESAIARQLADGVRTMVRQTTSLKDHRAAYSFDSEPLVEIESSSLSAKSIAELVNRLRAKRRYSITGEVTHVEGEKLNLTVRVEDKTQATFSFAEKDLPLAIDHAAEYILAETEPYIYAAHLLTNGREEEALKWIRICITEGQGDNPSWGYNLWGVYFLERNQYAAAVEKFNRALQLDPGYGVARYNLAQARERQGRWAEALKELRAAAALTKSAPALRMAILKAESRVLAHLGQGQEAIKVLLSAIEAAPNDRDALFALAKLYVRQSDYRAALPYIRLASELGGLDLDIDRQYALILDRLGMRSSAIAVYRRVVMADPKDILFRRRLDTLTRGETTDGDADRSDNVGL